MSALILGSTSPYRRALLERLGLEFRCVAPQVDEEATKARIADPTELAVLLARAKAEDVAARHPDACVIGSDQVCALGGRAFGKPGSVEATVEQLLAMAGREHQLVTAVCLVHPERSVEFVATTRLTLRPLTRERAQRYVELDDTSGVAGGYKIEQRGIALFDRIETEDHTAIVGLPLMRLARELEGLGIAGF